jgi:protein-S-isoprenylcysteine O-methyltransferase Ste14
MIEGQPQQIAIFALMALGAGSLLQSPADAPTILFLTSYQWAVVSIALAGLHQLIVAIGFRLQLHRNWITNRFGDRDMQVWAIVFMPLLVARPITLILIGWADTVAITSWRIPELALGLGLIGIAIWGMHSVLVYFTLPRALGGDHFRDEIANMPMVNKGVFKYTANGMYGVVFLGFWGIALAFGSWNALIVALFQHAFIWVHMYCTEGPDMRRIYG